MHNGTGADRRGPPASAAVAVVGVLRGGAAACVAAACPQSRGASLHSELAIRRSPTHRLPPPVLFWVVVVGGGWICWASPARFLKAISE